MIELSRSILSHSAFGIRALFCLTVASTLSACETLGSTKVLENRAPLNEAVAVTARQQTLMNIVRVYHNEPPVILDLVESDESDQLGLTAGGGVGGIGARAGTTGGTLAGETGSATAGVAAQTSVQQRYVPLQGQAAISQLSSPITVETLTALYDSEWNLNSIVEFAINRLAPSQDDFTVAEDLLTQLDADRAISLATAKSSFSMDSGSSVKTVSGTNITVQTQTPPAGGGDTLNVYLTPGSHSKPAKFDAEVWDQFSALYRLTQPDQSGAALKANTAPPHFIELRNSPRTHNKGLTNTQFAESYFGPVMRTRTAFGILRYLVTQPKIAFLSPQEYSEIRLSMPWNSFQYFSRCAYSDSYVLDPSRETGLQVGDPNLFYHAENDVSPEIADELHRFLGEIQGGVDDKVVPGGACIYSYPVLHRGESKLRKMEDALNELKRFILIVRSDQEPSRTFAEWRYDGKYYAVMADDLISQRNLMLLSQFLTIQSTTSPAPALTTISASGR